MITKCDKTLTAILESNSGIITSAEAQSAGVSRTVFLDYASRHGLERVSRGVYVAPGVIPDELVLLQRRFTKAVFSYGSALYLHDLSDSEPMPITVTVDSNYNATSLQDEGVRICYVKPEWYKLGIEDVKTPAGSIVKAYNKERTIIDLIRKRNEIDAGVFRQAIQNYARSTGKDLARLSLYAREMKVESRVYDLMEVAL